MPLKQGSSKAAFSQNVKTEMDAGKPMKQSLAIAYATKRRNKKPKGYARGGIVDPPTGSLDDERDLSSDEAEALRKRNASQNDDEMVQNPDEDHDIFENNEDVANLWEGGKIPQTRSIDAGDDDSMLHGSAKPNPAVEDGAGLEEGSGHEGHQPSDSLHGGSLNEDIVDSIMYARKKMAEGGMVEDAGDSSTAFAPEDAFNQHGQESNLKENYASDLSNEDHDQSIIGQILSERKKKRS